MPFPVREATNTSGETSSTSTHTVALPSGIQAGDVLILHFDGPTVTVTVDDISGWTTIWKSSNRPHGWFFRIASGSEGSTVAVTTSSAIASSSHLTERWSGGNGEVEGQEAAFASNPPSLSPSWGAEDTAWIAAVHGSPSGPPANYTGFINNSPANQSTTNTSYRHLNASSEDPGAFSGSSTAPSITIAIRPAAGGGAFTLTADGGSYAVTGGAAALKFSRAVVAGGGSYALTGSDVTFVLGVTLDAEAGAYTLTGQDAGFARTYVAAADAGSYTLAGAQAGLLFGRRLGAEAGAYAITGQDAAFSRDYLVAAAAGSYALTGSAADLHLARKLAAEAGAYALTGSDADLIYTPFGAFILTADGGSYALSGQPAGLLYGRLLAGETGAYVVTGAEAGLVYTPAVSAGRGQTGGGFDERYYAEQWRRAAERLVALQQKIVEADAQPATVQNQVIAEAQEAIDRIETETGVDAPMLPPVFDRQPMQAQLEMLSAAIVALAHRLAAAERARRTRINNEWLMLQ